MPASLRVLRRRIRSSRNIAQITKAQETVATSRISKAQARVENSRPYVEEFTNVLTQASKAAATDHPLLVARENVTRVGVLVVTSDRGLCGGYNANVLRLANKRVTEITDAGHEPMLFVVGRKGRDFFRFREPRDRPELDGVLRAAAVRERGLGGRLAGVGVPRRRREHHRGAGGGRGPARRRRRRRSRASPGSTSSTWSSRRSPRCCPRRRRRGRSRRCRWRSSRAPTTTTRRARTAAGPATPSTTSSPRPTSSSTCCSRSTSVPGCSRRCLDAAASESAARRRAMKAATDNANELIDDLTREANQARQAQITQEISEIVGGADALATAGE